MDISPEWIDMMLDFATGSVGRVAVDAGEFARDLLSGGELELNDIPIIRKVVGEVGSSAEKAEFYDAFYEIEDIRSELSRIRREMPGDYAGAVAGIGKRRELLEFTRETKSRMNAIKKVKAEAANGAVTAATLLPATRSGWWS
jgi:hypothetical protein